MSIFDRFVHWWDYGLRAAPLSLCAASPLHTYRVVLANGPDQTVKADQVRTNGGVLRFLVDGKVVASWPETAVVGWSAAPQ